jgi:invasion protein IalB
MLNIHPTLARTTVLAVLAVASLSTPLMAEESSAPALLPGGASSLSETHGDWTVGCQVVARDTASERVCGMSQRQTNAQGQQVLSVELLRLANGFEGAIVLPFGLAVTQPVTLTIDQGETITASFSTCVPNGCVVPLATDSQTLAAMRSGAQLVVGAQNVNGQSLELPVSLTGFAAAATRTEALTQ